MSPMTSESGGKSGGKTGGADGAQAPARITVLALTVLTLIFIFENTGATRIRLLVPEVTVTVPLWTAMLATGVVGALCGAYVVRRRG
ncbi:DUF1049 domain-containing protein [Streptomyces sp. NPDC006259]|uniref:DUF1049 domain-containing protein n=1 Tax=unclassified Streptomyces TaxID=2593676 RepID=UPI0033A0B2EE